MGAALHCGAWASPHGRFSCYRAEPLGPWASVAEAHGLSSGGSQALEYRQSSSCSTRAKLLRGTWDLPRPGIDPKSLALAGRFFTTESPGKPHSHSRKLKACSRIYKTSVMIISAPRPVSGIKEYLAQYSLGHDPFKSVYKIGLAWKTLLEAQLHC